MSDRSYKDLLVWRKAVDLAVASHQLTRRLPVSEVHGLSAEIRRASARVPAELAGEGARLDGGSYRRSMRTARGALARLDSSILVAQRLGYLPPEACEEVTTLVEEVGRLLAVLMDRHRPRTM